MDLRLNNQTALIDIEQNIYKLLDIHGSNGILNLQWRSLNL